jgi:hypothetical protein
MLSLKKGVKVRTKAVDVEVGCDAKVPAIQ